MEDNEEKVQEIEINEVIFSTAYSDRGSYIVIPVYASDENDPVGHFEIKKSDPNYETKLKLYRNAIMYINNVLRPS